MTFSNWRRTCCICSKAAYCRIRLGISLVILIRPSNDERSFRACTLLHKVSLRSFMLFQIVDRAAQTDIKSWTSSSTVDNELSAEPGRSSASFAFATISESEHKLVSRLSKDVKIDDASCGSIFPEIGFSSFHCATTSPIFLLTTLSSAKILARKASLWSSTILNLRLNISLRIAHSFST